VPPTARYLRGVDSAALRGKLALDPNPSPTKNMNGQGLYAQYVALAERLAGLAPQHQQGVNLGSWLGLVASIRQVVAELAAHADEDLPDGLPHVAIPEGYKRCRGPCGQVKRATSTYFRRDKTKSGGLRGACKVCMSVKVAREKQVEPQEAQEEPPQPVDVVVQEAQDVSVAAIVQEVVEEGEATAHPEEEWRLPSKRVRFEEEPLQHEDEVVAVAVQEGQQDVAAAAILEQQEALAMQADTFAPLARENDEQGSPKRTRTAEEEVEAEMQVVLTASVPQQQGAQIEESEVVMDMEDDEKEGDLCCGCGEPKLWSGIAAHPNTLREKWFLPGAETWAEGLRLLLPWLRVEIWQLCPRARRLALLQVHGDAAPTTLTVLLSNRSIAAHYDLLVRAGVV
jgi:hypothetical protein